MRSTSSLCRSAKSLSPLWPGLNRPLRERAVRLARRLANRVRVSLPGREFAMRTRYRISRRDMLLAGAAGGVACAAGGWRAVAQGAKRIEQMAPELGNIIDTNQQIRELATGFGGDIGPAEGPVWFAEGHYLLFSDIQTARRMKYTPGQGVTLFKDKTNEANGTTRDLQGRLIAAEHLTRRVTRTE